MAEDDPLSVEFFSFSYILGSVIMLAGVVGPFAYMLLQNKKTLRSAAGWDRAQ